MKVCGIIAEYDPFHLGHQYQLREAKRLSGCDFLVCVISTAFTQRGSPALFSTRDRTKMALLGGADAVLALPADFSVAEGDLFALGGVGVLNALSCVDALSFGMEDADKLPLFQQAAELLNEEPEVYRAALRARLDEGLSFPRAQSQALAACLRADDALFRKPNNILALGYLKALLTLRSPIAPIPVSRVGSRDGQTAGFLSSSAVREMIRRGSDYSAHLPPGSVRIAREALAEGAFCPPDALDKIALYRLRQLEYCGPDASDRQEGIGRLLQKHLSEADGVEALIAAASTSRYTKARLRRFIARNVLMLDAEPQAAPSHARLLAFRQDARPLLRAIKEGASLPVVEKPAAYRELLAADAFAEGLWAVGAGAPQHNLFRESPWHPEELPCES
ncbi:MAG: nucleotidyltransferase family protein [Clostridia bacterium]|nr:nucleotidyltransferase family protein [Clostridia bacterium]